MSQFSRSIEPGTVQFFGAVSDYLETSFRFYPRRNSDDHPNWGEHGKHGLEPLGFRDR